MKRLFILTLVAGIFAASTVNAQEDKSKRPSPPAVAKETIKSGATLTIDYSQPSLKGRKIGTELAPYGKVWRTGANEATTFKVDKAVKVEGKPLPAGTYSLHSIPTEKEWTIIFNKTADQWGSYKYTEADDALRVVVKPGKAPATTEKMTFTIDKSGKVTLLWGDIAVPFTVK
ncbi:DUF2911 domain-containing protein [Pedobacter sp. GR22-6]|uniref:DUF2911 domain-containing protein n=1 Tax=Pedobacter sp. GR22-6 TaxID=3127957 RepID=UPI00307DF287